MQSTSWRLAPLLTAIAAVSLLAAGCGDEPEPAEADSASGAAETILATERPEPAAPAPLVAEAEAETSDAPSGRQGKPVERWYAVVDRNGARSYLRVVWAPSTWEGRPTVRDTTTRTFQSVRNMMGTIDRFETQTTTTIERSADGSLWWVKNRVEEGERVAVDEVRWTGEGYVLTASGLDGGREIRHEIRTDEPVMIDAEAFLGPYVRAGEATVGRRFELPQLDWRERAVQMLELEVVATTEVPDETGEPIEAIEVVQRHPDAGTETRLWLDRDGAVVRLVADGGTRITRTTRQEAESTPVVPSQTRITTTSEPVLPRIMSADRLLVDVRLQGDSLRKLPEFPDSPWSRALGVRGSDAEGWVIPMELKAYDDPDATARIPVTDERFARQLEATPLMQADDERIVRAAAEVVDGETDARKAAYKLARFVYRTLRKTSPEVGQASALQILEERCGDCSEHALLFVTLCRAAGIPARRCSGYVNIGMAWGAHAWAEIWVGRWIGADPTTGEIGTGARYVFFGYPEEPGSFPGVVSSRIADRIRFVATRVEEGGASWDLTDEDRHRIHDRPRGRYAHVLAGIRLEDVPEAWTVRLVGNHGAQVRGEGWAAMIHASADQGVRLDEGPAGPALDATFGGQPARLRVLGDRRHYQVHSRRRIVNVLVEGAGPEVVARLERALRPTFAPQPPAWDPHPAPPQTGAEGGSEEAAARAPADGASPEPVPAGR